MKGNILKYFFFFKGGLLLTVFFLQCYVHAIEEYPPGPPGVWFTDVFVTHRVDLDDDGYSRQIEIVWNINSNIVNETCFVKIFARWEDGRVDFVSETDNFIIFGASDNIFNITIFGSELGFGLWDFALELWGIPSFDEPWDIINFGEDTDIVDVPIEPASKDIPKNAPPKIISLILLNPSIDSAGVLMNKEYILQIKIKDEDGYADIEYADIILDPLMQKLEYRWTKESDVFSKIYDPQGYTKLVSSKETSQNINNEILVLQLTIVFEENYPDEKMRDVKVISKDNYENFDTNTFHNIYYIKKEDIHASKEEVIPNEKKSTIQILRENAVFISIASLSLGLISFYIRFRSRS